MAITKQKGDIGEAMVMAEAMKRGYKVAIPVGEDWRYDLIVLRNEKLERIQCKYVESDGKVIEVKCRSTSEHGIYKYSKEDLEWIVTYDKTSDKCYFVPSFMLENGRSMISLRLVPTINKQKKKILWAKDFLQW